MLQNPLSRRRLHLKVLGEATPIAQSEPIVTIYDCFTDEEEEDPGPVLNEIGIPTENSDFFCVYRPVEGTAVATTNIAMAVIAMAQKPKGNMNLSTDLFEEGNYKIHGRDVKHRVPLCRKRAS